MYRLWAVEHCYSHVLTMDQDSCWINFDKYVENLYEYEKLNDLTIITPNINNLDNCNLNVLEKTTFITSGTIFQLIYYYQLDDLMKNYLLIVLILIIF